MKRGPNTNMQTLNDNLSPSNFRVSSDAPPTSAVPVAGGELPAWLELFTVQTKLPLRFVEKFQTEGRLRFDGGVFSMSVPDRNGSEVGAFRLGIGSSDWVYQGDPVFPLVFGNPKTAAYAFIASNPGDLLAVMYWLGWHNGGFAEDTAFISTGQDPLLSLTGLGINPDAAVLALPTNSRQAADWLAALGKAFEGREFYQVMAPIEYSGFAAWLQSGATPENFNEVLKQQKVSPYSVVLDPKRVEWRRTEGEQVLDALTAIPSDNPDLCRQVGAALFAAQSILGAVAARDLWKLWSQADSNIEREFVDREWASFASEAAASSGAGPDAREGLAEIYRIAKQYGWKPLVLVAPHGGPHSVFAGKMGKLLAETGTVFQHGREPVEVATTASSPVLKPIIPARASTLFEQVARLQKLVKGVPTLALWPEKDSKISIHAAEFLRVLPEIRIVTNCPVLVERADGTLVAVQGFDLEAMVYAGGVPVEECAFEEAVALINGLAEDFLFETPGDRARFIAGVITPALVPGGLLGVGGRPPMEVTFGDQSQAGKGFRNKLITAISNSKAITLNCRTRGVGGLDESIDAALRVGSDFIVIDNARGQVDSQKLESVLTEDWVLTRSSYSTNAAVDPTRTTVLLTSNGATLTTDALNRSSIVRIRKQPSNYLFPKFPAGDILAHVRANQPKYLGAVFAIVREWHRRGKPELEKTGHDFRAWAQRVGWIVENLLGTAPLMEGHGETQWTLANPNLTWLRDVGLAVLGIGAGDQDLQAARIVEILEQKRPELLESVLSDTAASGEGDPGNKRLLAMGRKLAACFTGKDPLIVVETGEIRVTRTEKLEQRTDGLGTTPRRSYRFEFAHFGASQTIPTLPPESRRVGTGTATAEGASTHQHPSAPIAPKDDYRVSMIQVPSGEVVDGAFSTQSANGNALQTTSCIYGTPRMDAAAAMGAMGAGSVSRQFPGPGEAWWSEDASKTPLASSHKRNDCGEVVSDGGDSEDS